MDQYETYTGTTTDYESRLQKALALVRAGKVPNGLYDRFDRKLTFETSNADGSHFGEAAVQGSVALMYVPEDVAAVAYPKQPVLEAWVNRPGE